MADPTLNINVKANTEQAQASLRNFKTTFTELKSAVDLAVMGFGLLKDAAIQAFEMGQAGAELERTRGQLDSLAGSIDTTTAALINGMREASSGMMSNAEMIDAATQIISLGLADNEGDVIRLATIVSELGWDMQQVILTFANNSTARLDALGLSIEDVTGKAKEFEEQGFNADKAFDLAVMDAAEDKIGIVGSAAETAAGQYAIMEANAANLNDELKMLANRTLLPVVIEFNNQATAAEKATEAYELGLITLRDYMAVAYGVTTSLENKEEALLRVEDALLEYNESIDEATEAAESYDHALLAMGETVEGTVGPFFDMAAATELTGSAAIHAATAMEQVPAAISNIELSARAATTPTIEFEEATRKLGTTNKTVKDDLKNTIKQLKNFADPQVWLAKQLMDEIITLWSDPKNKLTNDDAAAAVQSLVDALENGTPVLESAASELLGYNDAAEATPPAVETDVLLESGEAIADLEILAAWIEALDGSVITIDVDVDGDPGGGGGGGGGDSGWDTGGGTVPGSTRIWVAPIELVGGGGTTGTSAGASSFMSAGETTVMVFLDGEEIAARTMTLTGRDARMARNSGARLIGR